MKISKLLPIALAFTLCASSAVFAEGEIQGVRDASAVYQLTLPEYLKITATSPGSTEATYDDGYTGLTLGNALSGTFTVISNNPDKVIYLQGNAVTAGAAQGDPNTTSNALFMQASDPNALVLVFTNESRPPQGTAVSNITSKTATSVELNADAIAFTLAASDMENTLLETTATPTWDDTKKQVQYAIDNGTTNFTYTLGTTAYSNTFSLHDTMGTYKATLTMTDTSL